MSTVPTPRIWVLGWLADREYFIELGRQLNLCKGPQAEDTIELEAAAIHHVIVKTWWPNLMQCVVGGSDELVFAVYVDCKRRSYPPQAIPRSELLPRKYCERLEAWMPLDEAPQWFTCEDGSYTPWRHARHEPSVQGVWLDISRYQPHPGADYDVVEHVEEEDDSEEYYEEDSGSEIMDVGEDGQEYLDDADYVEGDYVEEGDYVGEEYIAEDGELVYAEGKATLVEDDDSVTVRGDSDMEDADKFNIMDSEHDDDPDAADGTISPADVSEDVSASLSSALDAVAL
ncbi:hypothetical protein FOMPIDRAFT_1060209 [Fomitopsis schrenkii]|uniref:Uncharacterized protein n=1 Tax=Fomitopsis schrenkii TaxID=2126942 RepID=S8EBI0_FOMSC|nr:hypothetical protein FOMPIDRAFT_1060209 [Fomitopsis schrenkii]